MERSTVTAGAAATPPSPRDGRAGTASGDCRDHTALRPPPPERCGPHPTATAATGSSGAHTPATPLPALPPVPVSAPQRSAPCRPRTWRTGPDPARTPGLAGIPGPIGGATGARSRQSRTSVAAAPRSPAGTIGKAAGPPPQSSSASCGQVFLLLRAFELGWGGASASRTLSIAPSPRRWIDAAGTRPSQGRVTRSVRTRPATHLSKGGEQTNGQDGIRNDRARHGCPRLRTHRRAHRTSPGPGRHLCSELGRHRH